MLPLVWVEDIDDDDSDDEAGLTEIFDETGDNLAVFVGLGETTFSLRFLGAISALLELRNRHWLT